MSAADEIPHAHHEIDYVERAVTDVAVAGDFYAAAFGWSPVDYGPDYAAADGRWAGSGATPRSAFTDPAGNELAVWSDG